MVACNFAFCGQLEAIASLFRVGLGSSLVKRLKNHHCPECWRLIQHHGYCSAACAKKALQAQRKAYNGIDDLPLPEQPTHALPGTFEKVQVMRTRYWSRQHLYHPNDATWPKE